MTLGGSTGGLATTHIMNLPPELRSAADAVAPYTGAACVTAWAWLGLHWLSQNGYLRFSVEIGRPPSATQPAVPLPEDE